METPGGSPVCGGGRVRGWPGERNRGGRTYHDADGLRGGRVPTGLNDGHGNVVHLGKKRVGGDARTDTRAQLQRCAHVGRAREPCGVCALPLVGERVVFVVRVVRRACVEDKRLGRPYFPVASALQSRDEGRCLDCDRHGSGVVGGAHAGDGRGKHVRVPGNQSLPTDPQVERIRCPGRLERERHARRDVTCHPLKHELRRNRLCQRTRLGLLDCRSNDDFSAPKHRPGRTAFDPNLGHAFRHGRLDHIEELVVGLAEEVGRLDSQSVASSWSDVLHVHSKSAVQRRLHAGLVQHLLELDEARRVGRYRGPHRVGEVERSAASTRGRHRVD